MAANGHGTKRFCLGINISMEAKVKTDEIASQEGITRSELIRRALYQFLQGRGLSTRIFRTKWRLWRPRPYT